jgi:hypothetical protein
LTAEDTEQMAEFYALLEKATSVQKHSQYTREFSQLVTFKVLVTQWQQYRKGKALRFKRPSLPRPMNDILGQPNGDDDVEKPDKILFCQLSEMTHTAMKKLQCALTTRYFYRYHPTKAFYKPSRFYGRNATLHPTQVKNLSKDCKYAYVFEISGLLCPAIQNDFIKTCCQSIEIDESSDLNDVQNVIYRNSDKSVNVTALRIDFAKFLEDLLWSIIKNLAIKFYDDNKDSRPGEPQKKRQRTQDIDSSDDDDDNDTGTFSQGWGGSSTTTVRTAQTNQELVDNEVKRFLSLTPESTLGSIETCNVKTIPK